MEELKKLELIWEEREGGRLSFKILLYIDVNCVVRRKQHSSYVLFWGSTVCSAQVMEEE